MVNAALAKLMLPPADPSSQLLRASKHSSLGPVARSLLSSNATAQEQEAAAGGVIKCGTILEHCSKAC
jgi:hypothetical protein